MKMKTNSDEKASGSFWSELDESDEDFEALIGTNRKIETHANEECKNNNVSSDNKLLQEDVGEGCMTKKEENSFLCNKDVSIVNEDFKHCSFEDEPDLKYADKTIISKENYREFDHQIQDEGEIKGNLPSYDDENVAEHPSEVSGSISSENNYNLTQEYVSNVMTSDKMEFLWSDDEDLDVFSTNKIRKDIVKSNESKDSYLHIEENCSASNNIKDLGFFGTLSRGEVCTDSEQGSVSRFSEKDKDGVKKSYKSEVEQDVVIKSNDSEKMDELFEKSNLLDSCNVLVDEKNYSIESSKKTGNDYALMEATSSFSSFETNREFNDVEDVSSHVDKIFGNKDLNLEKINLVDRNLSEKIEPKSSKSLHIIEESNVLDSFYDRIMLSNVKDSDKEILENIVDLSSVQDANSGFVNSQIPKNSELKQTVTNLKYSSTKFDSLCIKPLMINFGRIILTYSLTKQKRYDQEGSLNEKEMFLFNFFKLDYKPYVIDSKRLTFNDNLKLRNVYQLLSLNNPNVDDVCKIIDANDTIYCDKNINEVTSSFEINTVLDLAISHKKTAVEYAIKKNMWPLALIISNNDKEVVKKYFNYICDSDKANLVLNAFDINEESFFKGEDWKVYIKHLLKTKGSASHRRFLNVIGNRSDLFFVLITFHILNILNFGEFISLAFLNFEILEILMYVESKFGEIKDLDLLKFQYVMIMREFDHKIAEEFYRINKKSFRRELRDVLDENFNMNWSFGLKDVLNFGISKILNVEEKDFNNECVKTFDKKQKVGFVYGDIEKKFNFKQTSQEKKMKSTKDHLGNVYARDEIIVKSNEVITEKKKVVVEKEFINEMCNENIDDRNTFGTQNSVIEEEKDLNKTAKKERTLYSDNKHAKSFADIMDLEKPSKEITTEDDTALFLSKYAIDDDEEKKEKKLTKTDENKSSFFGLFNIFKKPVYKVDIEASGDIRYDPITKKWVSDDTSSASSTNLNTLTSPAHPNSTGIPKPSIHSSNSKSRSTVDLKKMSLYANKKTGSTASIPGMVPPKKNNK